MPKDDGDLETEIARRQAFLMKTIDRFCSEFCLAWNTGGQGKTGTFSYSVKLKGNLQTTSMFVNVIIRW